MDIDVVEHSLLSPVVAREVGDLLRCAGTLDRAGRHGEDRAARSHVADKIPCAGREVEPVVRRHTVAAERLLQSLGAIPVELDAGTDDKHVVLIGCPVGAGDRVVFGVDGRGSVLDPCRTLGHHRGLGPSGRRRLRLAAADEGPQRLVVVRARRFDDGDVDVAPAQQAGRDRDAGRAAPDDEEVMPRGGHGVPLPLSSVVAQTLW